MALLRRPRLPARLAGRRPWTGRRPRFRRLRLLRRRGRAAPSPPTPQPPAAPVLPPAAEPPRSAAGERRGGIRATAAAAGSAAARLPAAVGHGGREFWLSLSYQARRRLGLALGVAAGIALIWIAVVPALPCQLPGGDTCAPADDAIGLVPDDSLAYVHLNVDPETEQFGQASEVASRVPAIARQVTDRLLARLPGPGGGPLDFQRDVQPWFGGEAALAIVPAGGGNAEEVQLLEASDGAGARKFADSIAAGKPHPVPYRDVEVRTDRRGLSTVLVGGFLAIGRESGVRDIIDAQSGAQGTGSLADDPAASAARDALPDKRVADAYLSEDGIASLVANPGAPLATLAAAINPGASRGAAIALVAADDGLEVAVRSGLDPERAKAHPGFFSAFPSFEPKLAASLPSDSLGYVGIGDPGKTIRSLLEQASVEEPGLAAAVGALVKRVKKLGQVDLQRDLLPSLGGEAAFALEPAPPGKGAEGKGGGAGGSAIPPPPSPPGAPPSARPPQTGALPTAATPFLELVGSDIDGARASQALARLQGPIAKALNPSHELQAPVFTQHKVADVTAHSLRLSRTVDLTYAVIGSTLVVATDPSGVQQLGSGQGGLDGADPFEAATAGLPGEVSVLGYLDLQGLIALGEKAGLSEDPAYATFAPEIRRLEALGLAVQSSADELATDLHLVVAESAPAATAPAGRAPSD